MTPIEFLDEVLRVAAEQELTREQAYHVVEREYYTANGRTRYANFDSFSYATYHAQIKRKQRKAAEKEVKDTLYDAANRHREQEISTPEFVTLAYQIILDIRGY